MSQLVMESIDQRCEQAIQLARKKHYYQAVEKGHAILQRFEQMSWIQKLWTDIWHHDQIEEVEHCLLSWQQEVTKVEALVQQAADYVQKGQGKLDSSPWIALGIYEYCEQQVKDGPYQEGRERCKSLIAQRQTFDQLVKEANTWIEQSFFQQAQVKYQQAQELLFTNTLATSIQQCEEQKDSEILYEQSLIDAYQLAQSGQFESALALVESAHQSFPRSDGAALIRQLVNSIEIEMQLRKGLIAEQANQWSTAKTIYQQVLQRASDLEIAQIRLAIVCLKCQEIQCALDLLANVHTPQGGYLRGLAYAMQADFVQVEKEWQGLSNIETERHILQQLQDYYCQTLKQDIQEAVEIGNLEQAKHLSQTFFKQYGEDHWVQANLDQHIEPCLMTRLWQTAAPKDLADHAEQIWLQQPSTTNLHNWAIACLRALNSGQGMESKLPLQVAITSVTTALANINDDPAIKQLPWIEESEITPDKLIETLKQGLENYLRYCQEQNLEFYLQLHDHYRLDIVVLNLIQNEQKAGATYKHLTILPGCYHRHGKQLAIIQPKEQQLVGSSGCSMLN